MKLVSDTSWQSYAVRSGNLRLPCHIPRFIINKKLLESEITNCFKNFSRFPEFTPMLRVFDHKGGIRFDLNEQLMKDTRSISGDLDPWIRKTLKTRKYGIAFKEMHRWNESLHEIVVKNFTEKFIHHFGVPFGGFEFYCFLGNYGYTPFGIHNDKEHSLLFNLGPGTREVWIWTKERYLELKRSLKPSVKFSASFLDTAQYHFLLKENDFCHIPAEMFHVFKSSDYSLMMGVIPYPFNALDYLGANVSLQGSEPTLTPAASRHTFKAAAKYFNLEASKAREHRYYQLLSSNAYLKVPPLPQQQELQHQSYLSLKCPVLYLNKIDTNFTELIGAGTSMTIPSTRHLIRAFKEFIAGKKVVTGDLVTRLNKEMEKDLVLELLHALLESGILKQVVTVIKSKC